MKLTDTACKNAKPKQSPYKIVDGKGMYLLVQPHGSKLWRLRYRFLGKESTLGLGSYPEVTLQQARDARDTARAQLREGINPAYAKKEEKRKALENAGNTFESLAREWHEHNKGIWTDRYANELMNRMEMDLFKPLGSYPVAHIRPPQVLHAMKEIENRGAHEIARRALQTCGQVFRFAIQTGRRVDPDPTRDLKGALKPVKKGHYAALEAKDLPSFLKTLDSNPARLYPQTLRAIRLLMLTFVRTSELINATWDEFDLEAGQWEIPAERMKMKKPHIVPLCKQSVALLKQQKELTGKWKWVFPNQVRPQKPMSNNTILMALKRMGYGGKMTGHGFRALAMSTIKERLHYRHEVVDRQLAHAPRNQVDAAYDRTAFLLERKKMMQEWANYLDATAAGGKVIDGKFKKRA